MTDEDLVRSYLEAQTQVDLEALRGLVTDDVELYGRKGLSASGVDAFVENAAVRYDHLDDVYELLSAESDGNTVVARVRRELRWRDGGHLTSHRELVFRYTLRDGRLAKIELVEADPWVRV